MKKMLSPKGMKILKFVHVLCAMFWVGALTGMWALSFWPVESGDEMYMLLNAILLLDNAVLIPGALILYVTAIIYGKKTNFGFFKYRWITAKWIISLVLTIVGTFYFHPTVMNAIDIVDKGRDAVLNDPQVLSAVTVARWSAWQFAALLAIVVISVFKPWKKKQPGKPSLNVAE